MASRSRGIAVMRGERDALPEVGQLMQRVAAVDELDRRAGVFVGEETGLHDGHVVG